MSGDVVILCEATDEMTERHIASIWIWATQKIQHLRTQTAEASAHLHDRVAAQRPCSNGDSSCLSDPKEKETTHPCDHSDIVQRGFVMVQKQLDTREKMVQH